MVSKIIDFVEIHKKEILFILSLGLTLKFNIIFEFEFDFNVTYKILLFVTIGYQVVKRIAKVITKKYNIK